MLENVQLCGYEVPTPIQKYCLPAISMGYDVIGIAQTGKSDVTVFSLPFPNTLQDLARRLPTSFRF